MSECHDCATLQKTLFWFSVVSVCFTNVSCILLITLTAVIKMELFVCIFLAVSLLAALVWALFGGYGEHEGPVPYWLFLLILLVVPMAFVAGIEFCMLQARELKRVCQIIEEVHCRTMAEGNSDTKSAMRFVRH